MDIFKSTVLAGALLLSACSGNSTAKADAAPQEKAKAETPAETPKASEKTSAITAKQLADGMYLLMGPGGNIAVSTGDDGVFVVDDKFDRFADEIIDQIASVSDKPIRYVINTHYHGDHTGGNGALKDVGAVIVAHDNVRTRMGKTFDNKLWNSTVEATEPRQWPVVTYSDTATFHFNGQAVEALHVSAAHTDGDSLVHFKGADILHMGDNYFNGMFPYVDIDGGGSLQGMIDAQTKAINMAGPNTQIIPGHGPMASRDDLTKSRDTLIDIQSRVKARMDAGDSLETILDDKILTDLKDFAAFIDEEKMVRIAHRSLGGT
jgi:glyoxylase-like metal-dependent hydrolase (beta-lactamase superfamily II)